MADFNALEALINAYIKQNGVQAITGQVLNGVLRGMVSALGKGWTVAGEAYPNTDPGTMTGPVAYVAHNAGTYTNFGGLVVNDGEVAFLKYNEQTWTKEVLASLAATASVDGNVGTPYVVTQFVNGVLNFDFHNMKGNPGVDGEDGDAAGFGTVNATVDANVGTPGVTVQSSGPNTAKNFTFQFTNLKGETGVTSCVVTVDNTTGTPSCAVSLVGQELHLDFHGLKGAQGDTGSSVDYPFTIVNNLTTNDATQALSAAMGVQLESEVSQLEQIVTTLAGKFYGVFDDDSVLPEGDIVGYALVGTEDPLDLFTFDGEEWTDTEILIAGIVGPPGPQGEQGIQGPPGVTNVVATVDSGTGVPSVSASISDGVLTLAFHNLKGLQGDTGSSVSYPFTISNNLTTDDATKALSAAMGVALKALIDNVGTNAGFQPSSDLDITDEDNNVLVRFKDGGIKTKNFNSEGVNAKLDGIEEGAEANDVKTATQFDSDLDIADENGNVLVRFKNGGIKTKYFDTVKYAKRPAGGYENFLVSVNAEIEDNYSETGSLQDDADIKQDRCIINLPVNYDELGEPVRLVIANLGSAGRIQSSTTKAYWTMPLVDTILAEGYAVMQVNGTPGETDGIATYGGMGTPAFLQSVQAAYKYVTEKYNIKRDGVLLSGWSQGTLKAWQIAANKVIPVKAAALFAPAVDLWKLQYAYAPQATREWMCEQFGFVEKEANKYVLDIFGDIYEPGDIVTKPSTYSSEKTCPTDREFAYILNNYETWLGYDPICWGTSKDIIGEQFRYRSWVNDSDPDEDLCFEDTCNIVPCPMKLFVGTADIYTTPKIVNWYKMMSDHGGMLCHVRTFQGGTHNFPSDYGTISVSTKYGGTITTNVPSWEGVLFLERFDY